MNIENITSSEMGLSNNGRFMQIEIYEKEIKRLQQENERLKEKNKMLQEDAWRNNANLIEMVKEELEKTDCEECEICEDYKSRIEKAVEYINYYGTTPEENDDTTCRHILKSLLDILNGRSDE